MQFLSDATYAVFDLIESKCGPVWTLDEAVLATASMAIDRDYVAKMHQRLESAGMLRRLRRGLFTWPTARIAEHPDAWVVAQKIQPRSTLTSRTALVALGHVQADPMLDRVVMSSSMTPVVPPGARRSARMLDDIDDDFRGELGPVPSRDGELNGQDTRIGMGRHLDAHRRRGFEIDDYRFVYCRIRAGQMFGNTMLQFGDASVRVMVGERAIVACYECPKLLGAPANFDLLQQVLPELDLPLLAAYADRTRNARAYKALDADLVRLLHPRP